MNAKPIPILGRFLRALAKMRFRFLGLATIKDIETEEFNALIQKLQDAGWKKTHEYDGFDAWIDYGCVTLKKASTKLTFEWDNWTEGSIEGPRKIVEALARESGLSVSSEWRWAEYDERRSAVLGRHKASR